MTDLLTLVKTVILLAVPTFILLLLVLIKRLLSIKRKSVNARSAFIVVLGDLGRSPRMNYHCLSLTKLGYSVKLVGYNETKQLDSISTNPNVNIVPLSVYPKLLQCKYNHQQIYCY